MDPRVRARSTVVGLLVAALAVVAGSAEQETAVAASTPQVTAWDEFLDKPTSERLKPIEETVNACGKDQECRKRAAPSSAQVGRLIRLVGEGQAVPAESGFLASTLMHFNGGDYDDLIRGLGGVCDRDPTLFLQLVSKYGKNKDLLLMLPYDAVDRPDLQRQVVERRIQGLASVTATDLEPVKKWALQVLGHSGGS